MSVFGQQTRLGQRTWRLAMCATAFGVSLATQTAHAAVVEVNFTSNPLSVVPFNIDGLYLNLVTGATGTASFSGYDVNPYFSGAGTATPLFRILATATGGGGIVGAGTTATILGAGTTIGPASSFISGVTLATAAASGTGYFGLRFLNEGTGAINYGYLTVSQTLPLAAGSVQLLSYAYENTGLPITISAVPEPSTALMLLGGGLLAGLAARRKMVAGKTA